MIRRHANASRHSPAAPGLNRCAFTLIELLVVVAIITALLAILLPSMGRATYAAQTVECASARRQLYVGFMSYTTDHFAKYPNWSRGYQVRGPHDIEWFMPAVLERDYNVPARFLLCQLAEPTQLDVFQSQVDSLIKADPNLATGNPKVFHYNYTTQVGWYAYWVKRGSAGEFASANPNYSCISDSISGQTGRSAIVTDGVVLVGSGASAEYVSDHRFGSVTEGAINLYNDGSAILTPTSAMEVRYSWWRPPYVW